MPRWHFVSQLSYSDGQQTLEEALERRREYRRRRNGWSAPRYAVVIWQLDQELGRIPTVREVMRRTGKSRERCRQAWWQCLAAGLIYTENGRVGLVVPMRHESSKKESEEAMEDRELMRVESRLEGLEVNPQAIRYVDGIEVLRSGEDRFMLPYVVGLKELSMADAARAIVGGAA